MSMKKFFNIICISLLMSSLWGCNDFFEVDPDDTIDDKDYISAQNEIYTGFYGILSKMQDMADHAIYLTDTRANFLETTLDAPEELQEIYSYGNISPTNKYADPSCYYSLIISCNDYMHKMAQYKNRVGGALDTAEEDWKALISSAIRVKAWTYLRLAQIYGEVIWFSDPMTDMKDLGQFPRMKGTTTIADKCLDLIDNGETDIEGLEGVNGNLKMDWATYLDPEGTTSDYDKWAYIVPDWLLLRCELLLWSSNPDYSWIRTSILNYLEPLFNTTSTSVPYLLHQSMNTPYTRAFYSEYSSYESVAFTMYKYTLNQINSLSKHFSPDYPNNYWLCPSVYAETLFSLGDNRLTFDIIERNGKKVMAKYLYGETARYGYQSDANVQLQRGHDYHFFLAEAENMLGHWDESVTIMNEGFQNRWSTIAAIDTAIAHGELDKRYRVWRQPYDGPRSSANYNNQGVTNFHCNILTGEGLGLAFGVPLENGKIQVHVYGGLGGAMAALDVNTINEKGQRRVQYALDILDKGKIPYTIDKNGKVFLANEAAREKFFDLQMLDEMLREYVAEGRAYGMMIRMAQKYNDPSIIADRVCPKYPSSLQDQVRARILSGHYFINWNL